MRNTDTAANGDRCPVDERHGKMFMQSTGRQWCAVQSHDMDRTPSLYEHDGVTPVVRKPVVRLEENVLAFTLPDKMKSALDTPPRATIAPSANPTFRTTAQGRAKIAKAAQDVSSQAAPAKAGVPFGGPGVVCRKPAGKVGAFCDNCGRTLAKSVIRKSGLEHAK